VDIKYGAAILHTRPSGATITAGDGHRWGLTPSQFTELQSGTWNFTLRLDNYERVAVSLDMAGRLSCCTALLRISRRRRKTDLIWRKEVKGSTYAIMKSRTHRGSGFRDFLKEQGILGEAEAHALEQTVRLQLARLLKEKEITGAELATRMKTSRAAVDRLLDASNASVTQNTLGKAARTLGCKVRIELVPA
jgi:antitoxin HicB